MLHYHLARSLQIHEDLQFDPKQTQMIRPNQSLDLDWDHQVEYERDTIVHQEKEVRIVLEECKQRRAGFEFL